MGWCCCYLHHSFMNPYSELPNIGASGAGGWSDGRLYVFIS
ncbi:MAG: hypothetical protein NZ576_01065 [Bacteroidia bacterium]|nr:hypothetical protein [Bacteroidia bacterium]